MNPAVAGILSSLPTQLAALACAIVTVCSIVLTMLPAPVAVPATTGQKIFKAIWQVLNWATIAFGNNKTTIASVHSGEVVPIEVHQAVVNSLSAEVHDAKLTQLRK